MSSPDTDRLAALLHEIAAGCSEGRTICVTHPNYHQRDAARLRNAGVTLDTCPASAADAFNTHHQPDTTCPICRYAQDHLAVTPAPLGKFGTGNMSQSEQEGSVIDDQIVTCPFCSSSMVLGDLLPDRFVPPTGGKVEFVEISRLAPTTPDALDVERLALALDNADLDGLPLRQMPYLEVAAMIAREYAALAATEGE